MLTYVYVSGHVYWIGPWRAEREKEQGVTKEQSLGGGVQVVI